MVDPDWINFGDYFARVIGSIVVRKKKIIEKEMTVYQNNSVDIKVDASVKVKEINRSNKNISIKEKSGNTYTILPKKVGKSVVTIQTNTGITGHKPAP